MPEYQKGDIVDFERASITINDTPIIAVVPQVIGFEGVPVNSQQWYIIEYVNGLVPDESRIIQFELDPNKKYLFVLEDELSQ